MEAIRDLAPRAATDDAWRASYHSDLESFRRDFALDLRPETVEDWDLFVIAVARANLTSDSGSLPPHEYRSRSERLEGEISRLMSDPRFAANSGAEMFLGSARFRLESPPEEPDHATFRLGPAGREIIRGASLLSVNLTHWDFAVEPLRTCLPDLIAALEAKWNATDTPLAREFVAKTVWTPAARRMATSELHGGAFESYARASWAIRRAAGLAALPALDSVSFAAEWERARNGVTTIEGFLLYDRLVEDWTYASRAWREGTLTPGDLSAAYDTSRFLQRVETARRTVDCDGLDLAS